MAVGISVCVGSGLGAAFGIVPSGVGFGLGAEDGISVGVGLGAEVGLGEGLSLGTGLGSVVGANVGDVVLGLSVGGSVSLPFFPLPPFPSFPVPILRCRVCCSLSSIRRRKPDTPSSNKGRLLLLDTFLRVPLASTAFERKHMQNTLQNTSHSRDDVILLRDGRILFFV